MADGLFQRRPLHRPRRGEGSTHGRQRRLGHLHDPAAPRPAPPAWRRAFCHHSWRRVLVPAESQRTALAGRPWRPRQPLKVGGAHLPALRQYTPCTGPMSGEPSVADIDGDHCLVRDRAVVRIASAGPAFGGQAGAHGVISGSARWAARTRWSCGSGHGGSPSARRVGRRGAGRVRPRRWCERGADEVGHCWSL